MESLSATKADGEILESDFEFDSSDESDGESVQFLELHDVCSQMNEEIEKFQAIMNVNMKFRFQSSTDICFVAANDHHEGDSGEVLMAL
jgi:hypothetical protein